MDYSFQILSVSSPYMDAIVQSLSSTPSVPPPPSLVWEILTVMYLFLKAVMYCIYQILSFSGHNHMDTTF